MTTDFLPSTGPAPRGLTRIGVTAPPPREPVAEQAQAAPASLVRQADSAEPSAAARPSAAPPLSPGGLSAVTAQVIAQEGRSGGQDSGSVNPFQLSPEEEAIVASLQARDREVRAHEAAHAAVGGAFAGAPQYEFERGPDGRQYAVSGSVSIDTSPVPGDPEATIRKMETVKRAALAPAQPSGQDRAVAQAAETAARAASAELAAQRAEEAREAAGGDSEQAARSGESSEVSGEIAGESPPTEFGPDPVSAPVAIDAFQLVAGVALASRPGGLRSINA